MWDGDTQHSIQAVLGFSVISPPRGIATGTPIFANAPCGVENLELKEKGLNF